MKSKFKSTAYLLVLGIILFSVILIFSSEIIDPRVPFWILLLVCFSFLFVWIWMFFGEIRTKIISIDIQHEGITIRRYLGLGAKKTYYLHGISGFKTSILRSKNGDYEYLYLMIGQIKIAKISTFYHSNYKELKNYLISLRIKNLGVEMFSNRQELKDILG
jgi:hypothetical protein